MKKNCNAPCKKTSIGGQALIEGIMMRGPKMTAMAVRNTEGEIVLEKWKNNASSKSKLKKLPLIRGVFGFIDSMTTGYKSLMRSAEISGLEEAEEEMKREKEAKKAAKRAKRSGTEAPVAENSVENNAEASAVEPSVKETAEAPSVEASTEKAKTEVKAKDTTGEKKKSSPMTTAVMVVAVILALALSLVLFMYLPAELYKWLCSSKLPLEWIAKMNISEGFASWLATPTVPNVITDNVLLNSFVRSAFEGVTRIILLVGYMFIVSRMKDIKRTFMYHGAEHKTIFCYEHGNELTVENVRREGRFHPRCGTSFLILMLIVGIVVAFFIDPLFIIISGDAEILEAKTYLIWRVLVKVATIPLIMGIGYELIKFAGKHDNFITRIVSAPGMWLQHLTVLEPTDDMIECAILAFTEVMPENEKKQDQTVETADGTEVTAQTEETEETVEAKGEAPIEEALTEGEAPMADETVTENIEE